MKRNTTAAILAIVITGCVSFMALESHLPFVETSDARYSQVACETLTYNHWIVPHQNAMKHITKPPLAYWFTALAYRLLGVHEASARLFPAIFGMMSALLLFFMGIRLKFSMAASLASALVFLTLPLVMVSGRILTTDVFLLFFILVAMDGFIRLRFQGHASGIWQFWIGLGLAGMVKGPIGFILASGIIVTFLAWERDLKWARQLLRPFPILSFLVLSFWWPIIIFATIPGSFDYLVVKQLFSRIQVGGFGHPKPPYYYIVYLPVALFPWIAFITYEFFSTGKDHRNSVNRLLLVWTLFPLAFFSIPSSKLMLYMLPAAPATAFLTGRMVDRSRLSNMTVLLIAVETLVLTVALVMVWLGRIDIHPAIIRQDGILVLVVLLIGSATMMVLTKFPHVCAAVNSVRFLLAVLLAIHAIQVDVSRFVYTTKPCALFLKSRLQYEPGPIICEGFVARGFVLYTGQHTYDGDADVETYPDEFSRSPYILEPYEKEPLWNSSDTAYLIRRSWDWAPVPRTQSRYGMAIGSRSGRNDPEPIRCLKAHSGQKPRQIGKRPDNHVGQLLQCLVTGISCPDTHPVQIKVHGGLQIKCRIRHKQYPFMGPGNAVACMLQDKPFVMHQGFVVGPIVEGGTSFHLVPCHHQPDVLSQSESIQFPDGMRRG